MIVVAGLNSLIENKGVRDSYKKILEGKDFEKLGLDEGDISKQLKQISSKTKGLFDNKVSFFGGDHSISYPLVTNFFKNYGVSSKLIVFDAHPDLMKPMAEPTHEEWLRAVVEEGFLPKNIMIVGVRRNSKNVDESEISYAKEKGIKIIYSDEFDIAKDEIISFCSMEEIYLSIDIDVLDSSIISSTGYSEKEGLLEDDFFPVLETISKLDNIEAFDLVEVNLDKGDNLSNERAILVSRKILKTLNFD